MLDEPADDILTKILHRERVRHGIEPPPVRVGEIHRRRNRMIWKLFRVVSWRERLGIIWTLIQRRIPGSHGWRQRRRALKKHIELSASKNAEILHQRRNGRLRQQDSGSVIRSRRRQFGGR